MIGDELKGYKFEKEIGKGAFSSVFLATKLDSGEKCAIKKIDISYVNDKRYKKYLNNEIYILNNINHENIIKYHGMKMSMNYIYLIFEYCNGGDLQTCLKNYLDENNKPFPQHIVQYIMKQIIKAFYYLHSRKILHRDIKLENILVKYSSEEDKKNMDLLKAEIKVTDFGFARYLKGDSLAKSLLGNPINMDPLILKKMARIDNDTEFGYDEKADIWSLGTITYELLVGCPAFEATSYAELIEKINKGNYKIPHSIVLSKEAICFLNGMMQYDPKCRLSVEELSKQYFLTRNPSTFHNIQMKKTEENLAQSIILNAKDQDDKPKFGGIYDIDINLNGDECDPMKTMDNHSICGPTTKKKLNDDVPDEIGAKIAIKKENEAYEKEGSNIKNVDPHIINYLIDKFDEMNKDCFYIEPLLIPTQPSDNYNSFDPISKFMDTL